MKITRPPQNRRIIPWKNPCCAASFYGISSTNRSFTISRPIRGMAQHMLLKPAWDTPYIHASHLWPLRLGNFQLVTLTHQFIDSLSWVYSMAKQQARFVLIGWRASPHPKPSGFASHQCKIYLTFQTMFSTPLLCWQAPSTHQCVIC